ncbi:MAG: hypothetical protein RIR00_183 [Pseudomonadota bacterium]|jgi:hydrogenase expression/formation protein HypC
MCLGIPMLTLEAGEHRCRCAGPDGEHWLDLSLVGPQPAGVWLLSFLGAARELISAERADSILSALAALQAAQAGSEDFSAFFADLEREPQLPEFLRNPT